MVEKSVNYSSIHSMLSDERKTYYEHGYVTENQGDGKGGEKKAPT